MIRKIQKDRSLIRVTAAAAASLLITAAVLSLLPVRGEEGIYDSVIRIHVLAASDSAEDQALKLAVRDAVLACTAPVLSECRSYGEACTLLASETARIKSAAEETIKAHGYDYGAAAELVTEKYPTRVYGDIALPGGTYTSMKITIGPGEGKNWWCVLFPAVCTSFSGNPAGHTEEEYLAVGFTPEQYRLITRDSSPAIRIRFRILELLSELIGFRY